jgi:flavin-dependent dehydrogenase
MKDETAMKCDVIVVGAGPAGCAAAIELARQGYAVRVLERGTLPQAKVCGDTLFAETLASLDRLGVGARARQEGLPLATLKLQAPGGRVVPLEINATALPRVRLHQILQDEVRRSGATLETAEVVGPLRQGERLCGVSVRGAGDEPGEIAAGLVIVASGARYATLEAFGLGLRPEPTAVGIRGYYRVLGAPVETAAHLAFLPCLGAGFGWVVPLPGGIYNIGCGRFLHGAAAGQTDLLQSLEAFIHHFEPAWRVVGHDDPIGLPCAGLLRSGLSGAVTAAQGVLVVGEAAGTASPLTGAGVARALESGLAAARTAALALQTGDFSAPFLARHGERLEEGRPLYRDLERAQRWFASPRRLNLLAWQAARHPPLRSALSAIIDRGAAPTPVFSLAGLCGRVKAR